MKGTEMPWLAPIAWALGAFGLIAGLASTADEGEARAQQSEIDAGISVIGAAARTRPVDPIDQASSAHLITTINTNEMVLARMATMRATRPDVRNFASTILRDHGASQDRITVWTEDNDVAPLGSPLSDQIAGSANMIRVRLDASTSRDFDRVYVESQITMHTEILRLLDERVVPGASNLSFRSMVERIRRDEARHLELAQRL